MEIMISGPQFHKYNFSIADAFRESGYNTDISNWPIYDLNLYQKLILTTFKKFLTIKNLDLIKDKIIRYNKDLVDYTIEKKPDILLILKGNIIFPNTLKKIKSYTNTKLIIWCYDSALRFNNIIEGGRYYDLFFTFEPIDIPILKKYGIKAIFLPQGYDQKIYHYIENSYQELDICFIGEIDNYPNRKKILGSLIQNKNELKIGIWGKSWSWYNPFLQFEYKIKKYSLGKNIYNIISPNQVNSIYNQTKICLNIHHQQSKDGLNPRTFEILGAGGFELVDFKKSLDDLFGPGEDLVYYKNFKDLLNSVSYYLENENERKKIAKKGNFLAKKNHTFQNRIKKIIKEINNID